MKTTLRLMLTTTVIAAVSGSAFANFTTIRDVTNEDNVATILQKLTGQNLSLDDINAGAGNRVDDAWDRIWRDGTTIVTFTALWWDTQNPGRRPHEFGYTLTEADGTTRTETLFNTKDVPLGHTVMTEFPIGEGDIRWFAINGPERDNPLTAWSDPTLNTEVKGTPDRMVTFDVSGLDLTVDNIGTFNAGPKAYVLFFETGSDGSYNDLVVLVQGPAPVVPAPAAAGLAFVGLAIVGWVKRRLA